MAEATRMLAEQALSRPASYGTEFWLTRWGFNVNDNIG